MDVKILILGALFIFAPLNRVYLYMDQKLLVESSNTDFSLTNEERDQAIVGLKNTFYLYADNFFNLPIKNLYLHLYDDSYCIPNCSDVFELIDEAFIVSDSFVYLLMLNLPDSIQVSFQHLYPSLLTGFMIFVDKDSEHVKVRIKALENFLESICQEIIVSQDIPSLLNMNEDEINIFVDEIETFLARLKKLEKIFLGLYA